MIRLQHWVSLTPSVSATCILDYYFPSISYPSAYASTFVLLNLRALIPLANRMSNSSYVRPLGSGSLKYAHTATHADVPAQKNYTGVSHHQRRARHLALTPVFPCQFHEVLLSMCGTRI